MPKNQEVQHANPTREACPDSTLAEALSVGQDVFQGVVEALADLPRKDLTRHYPATMADAVALVTARDDLKKKNAASKAAYKSRRPGTAPSSPKNEYYQGARPGGKEPSAFWMYTEDFFRDITQEDLRDILSHYAANPATDPAFNIPVCGSSDNRTVAHTGTGGGAKAGPSPLAARLLPPLPSSSFGRGPSSPPAFARPPPPPTSQQQQQPPASAVPVLSVGQATDVSTEKRSSRLAAKAATRQAPSFGDWDDDAVDLPPPPSADTRNLLGVAGQSEHNNNNNNTEKDAQQQQAIVGSPAIIIPPPPPMSTRSVAAIHAMYTPDVAGLEGTAGDGGGARTTATLMETLSDVTLAQLAIQLTELMQLTHMKEGKSKGAGSGSNAKGLDKALLNACKECLSKKERNTMTTSNSKGKKGGSHKKVDDDEGIEEDGATIQSEQRLEVEAWLVSQSTTLSKILGTNIDAMPPFWLPLSNPVYIAPKKEDYDDGTNNHHHQQLQEEEEEGEGEEGKEKGGEAPPSQPPAPSNTTTRGRRSASKDDTTNKKSKSAKSTPAASQPASPSPSPTSPHPAPQTAIFAQPVPFPRAGRVHPYIKMVLESKVPDHLIEAATEATSHLDSSHFNAPLLHQQQPATSAAGVGDDTPATTSVTTTNNNTPHSTQRPPPQDITTTTSAPLNGDAMDIDGGSEDGDGATVARSARARGKSQLNYAILAGTRKNPPRPPSALGKNKLKGGGGGGGGGGATPRQNGSVEGGGGGGGGGRGGQMHPVAAAVAACVAEATDAVVKPSLPPGGIDPFLLAAVPQDEVTAEMVALQAELATVMAVNRARLLYAMKNVLNDLPRQAEERSVRVKEEEDVKAWAKELQAIKQEQNRELQAAALREEMAQKQLAIVNSPHPVLGQRSGGGLAEDGTPLPPAGDGPILTGEELYDVLAQRSPEDEAFCAVCGDGHSEAPNQIIFCERCDVAVHQRCYDVTVVPEGEWLCWPCALHEEEERMAGKSQHDIRPPRWHTMQHEPMGGGARDVKCALCPIKYGAFRQTVDRSSWVHQACAMWTPELYLRPGEGPAVVDGLDNVKPERLGLNCVVCGVKDGAPVQCSHGQCQHAFHVLCARNVGLYLAARNDSQGRPQFKVYCAVHGPSQQERDLKQLASKVSQSGPAAAGGGGGFGGGAVGPRRPGRPPGAGPGGGGRGRRPDPLAPAKRALEGRLQERHMLDIARVNLEQCRMLVDQCKRRERLKRQKIMLDKQIHKERMINPAESLEYLQRQQQEQWISTSITTATAAAGGGVGAGAATSSGVAPSAIPAPHPPPPSQQPLPHPPSSSLGAAILAGQHGHPHHPLPPHHHYHHGGVPPVPPPSGVKITALPPHAPRGGMVLPVPPHIVHPIVPPVLPLPSLDGGTHTTTPASQHQSQQEQQPSADDLISGGSGGGTTNTNTTTSGARRSSTRGRKGGAAVVVNPAVDPVAGYDWNRAAQRVMTSRQLAEAQGQLPPKVKYFPVEELISGRGIKTMTVGQRQEQVELHQLAQQQQAELHEQQMEAQRQQRQNGKQQQYLEGEEEEEEEDSDDDFDAPTVLGSPSLERKMTRRRASRQN